MTISSFYIVNNANAAFEYNKTAFEQLYSKLRTMENRTYSDEDLRLLPNVPQSHSAYKEWKARKKSSTRLRNYILAKKQPLSILEIGCGNGWLAAYIATIPSTTVTGMDVNMLELKQATRVFQDIVNLKFIYADHVTTMPSEKYDLIIFAASIQYFPSLSEILSKTLQYLNPNGEIHIIDSPLYKFKKINQARDNAERYYAQLGLPEMNNYYFHHNIEQLNNFNHKILFNPSYKILPTNPFHWICVKGVVNL